MNVTRVAPAHFPQLWAASRIAPRAGAALIGRSMVLVLGWCERHARALTSLCSAGWLLTIVTVEWSYPYCNDPQDGPGWAVYGFPVPYLRFGGVSSLQYDVALHFWLLNIALGALAIRRPVSALLEVFRTSAKRRACGAFAAVGLAGLLATRILMLVLGFWRPVLTTNSSYAATYADLRPVRLTFGFDHYAYDCAPSRRRRSGEIVASVEVRRQGSATARPCLLTAQRTTTVLGWRSALRSTPPRHNRPDRLGAGRVPRTCGYTHRPVNLILAAVVTASPATAHG